MKKIAFIIASILTLYPVQSVMATDTVPVSFCTLLDEKKVQYEVLQQNTLTEAQEQKALFGQFQNLRNELQALRSQAISDSIIMEKSAEIDVLKRSIQRNKVKMESKIADLSQETRDALFTNAKEIMILTFQCTKEKIQKLQDRLTILSHTSNSSNLSILQPEINALGILQGNIESTIGYISTILDRETLKKTQDDMQVFLSDMKEKVQHAHKIYNYFTFDQKLNQFQNILKQVQDISPTQQAQNLANVESEAQHIQEDTTKVKQIHTLEEKADYLDSKRKELQKAAQTLKSIINTPDTARKSESSL